MYTFFDSDFFHFEFLRVLGTAPFEGCEIGKCLETIACIKTPDAESWFDAWRGFALLADPAGYGGEVLSLEVPYEHGLMLPAYLFMPLREAGLTEPIPVVVNSGGFDSTQEELYFYIAAGARRRGYAVLTFDGPGQGIFHRRLDQRAGFPAQAPEGAYMRHDWEAVIRPVLDRLWTYSKANQHLHLGLNRVSIFGESMGAYFALRGAGDPWIKACIAMDGFYDMWDTADSRIPPVFLKAWDRLGDRFFDRVIRSLGRVHFHTRRPGHFRSFSLRGDGEQGEYLARVQCPVFVTGAADWAYFPAQGNATKIFEVFNQLHPEMAKLWVTKGVGSGGLQAKVAAISVVHDKTFEWLDEVLIIDRKKEKSLPYLYLFVFLV
ncbi:Alpha/Beta hydrolase protein [Aspergillus flavus]|uniref:Alpha/Beta hydrolase protein n=1 Tax=Aspergillus flavus (strain ATCC 200026 / FGSC A1120 / IAM 13836 / NRRL 3357 / JCM 12722 / SRRC 167) TaxID=332952 RepID=A0A7U2N0D4_ASPFN|nr:Alpha/Beta hydrolase protein [Aspergillus flavus]